MFKRTLWSIWSGYVFPPPFCSLIIFSLSRCQELTSLLRAIDIGIELKVDRSSGNDWEKDGSELIDECMCCFFSLPVAFCVLMMLRTDKFDAVYSLWFRTRNGKGAESFRTRTSRRWLRRWYVSLSLSLPVTYSFPEMPRTDRLVVMYSYWYWTRKHLLPCRVYRPRSFSTSC